MATQKQLDALTQEISPWVEGFLDSPQAHGLTLEEQDLAEHIVHGFAELMLLHEERPPRRWTAGALKTICTRVMPERVAGTWDYFAAVVPVLSAFFRYARDQGHIRNGDVLARAVRGCERTLLKRARDRQRTDQAQQLLQALEELTDLDPSEDQAQQLLQALEELTDLDPSEDQAQQLLQALEELTGLDPSGEDGRLGNTGDDPFDDLPANAPHHPANAPARSLQDNLHLLAGLLEQNRPPMLTDSMANTLLDNPNAAMELLESLARLPSGELEDDDPARHLLAAHLVMLGVALKYTLLKAEGGRDPLAGERLARFQQRLAALIRESALSATAMDGLLMVMEQLGMTPSPELEAACNALEELGIQLFHKNPQLLHEQLAALAAEAEAEADGGLPLLVDNLTQLLGVLGATSVEPLLDATTDIDNETLWEAAELQVLHPESPTRNRMLMWLSSHPERLSPNGLRRMILLRNWLPKKEQSRLDRIIRAARKAGTPCAPDPTPAPISHTLATLPDPSGSMMLLFSSPAEKRRVALTGLLASQEEGLKDFFAHPSAPQGQWRSLVRGAMPGHVPHTAVTPAFANLLVRHLLQKGLENDRPPTPGLPLLAERFGIREWQPEALPIDQLMEEILTNAEKGILLLDMEPSIIASSAAWGEASGVIQTWFIPPAEAEALLHAAGDARNRDTMATEVVTRLMEPQRELWIERLAITALWFHHPEKRSKISRIQAGNFATVTLALLGGLPMKEVPLLHRVARQAVAFLVARQGANPLDG